MNAKTRAQVLVAGIGGASLGTEVIKCLLQAGRYTIDGCDISPLAYGHFQAGLRRTFLVDRQDYCSAVLDLCRAQHIEAVIPGGEEPLQLLAGDADRFRDAGIVLAMNNPAVVRACSDKQQAMATLARHDCAVPWTICIEQLADAARLQAAPYPCVLKPAVGSGSALVCLAADADEAVIYLRHLLKNTDKVVVQEYLPDDWGEYSIGVLSLPDGRIVQTTVLQRLFHNKLSLAARSATGLISSGHSQGYIGPFPELARQAERIATALGSTGPLNVQGRLRGDVLTVFEVNPRFSASTYLRTLAGFNEIDAFLGATLLGQQPTAKPLRPGYYLRSFAETYTPAGVA